jgi:starch-binding outer membrane protein SusE/F
MLTPTLTLFKTPAINFLKTLHMKKISKFLLPVFTLSLFLFSCTKDENKVFYEGGTAPVLSANKSGTIALSFANKDLEAVKFIWTNPNYQFTTGGSSQDVSYLLEIDTTNSNFTNPARKSIGISKDLSISISQNDLNDYLLNQLVLTVGAPHNIEMRVTSSINNTIKLYSNVVKFIVIPYAIPPKVTPPTTGKLYLVGSASPGGWNNPVPVPSQEFTKTSTTFYQLTVALSGSNSYLFLPLNGDWGVKFGAIGGNNSNNVNEDDFRQGGGDLLAPAVSGNYKIEVDFQRGKFKLIKL